MNEKIILRQFERDDIPALNEIMKKAYGFDRDESVWIWRFEENPFGRNYSRVAVTGERVIAHCGGIPVVFQEKGEKIPACLIGDIMADPNHREKGAFLSTFNAHEEARFRSGDQFSYGFANPDGTKALVDRTNACLCGPLAPRLDRIINTKPFIKRKLGSTIASDLVGAFANFFIRLFQSLRRPTEVEIDLIEEVNQFDDRFNELWERVSPGFPMTTDRNSQFLNWRYIEHPTHDYQIFGFVDKGELKGYIVLRLTAEEGITRGLIVDIVSVLDDPTVWNSLLIKGIDYMSRERADVITCWMFEHLPFYDALKTLSFVDRPSDLSLLVSLYENKRERSYWADSKNWYFTMGDSDIF